MDRSVCIIPARGGSTRVPGKNIRDFFGKPLLGYSIDAALRAGVFDEVVVSTEDEAVAMVAREYGASVPFVRPWALATDWAGTLPVLLHALGELGGGGDIRACCCLYTTPFVTPELLGHGMQLVLEGDGGVDCAMPVVRYPSPPQRGFYISQGRLCMAHPEYADVRTQGLEMYHDAGMFYCLRTCGLESRGIFGGDVHPIILPQTRAQDIDTKEDWEMAELKWRHLHGSDPLRKAADR